jgi:hypothetical protein
VRTLLLLSLAVLLLQACVFMAEPAMTLLLPDLPEDWHPIIGRPGWELHVLDGPRRAVAGDCWPQQLGPSLTRPGLTRPGPLPIVVFPIHGNVRLRPAGGICYPELHAVCRLDWSEGSLAAILLDLAEAGVDLRTLDVKRLRRLAGDLARPVDLDSQRLTSAVLSGTLRKTDIRELPELKVVISLPAGRWIWDTPERPGFISRGEPIELLCPPGHHRLFSGAEAFELQVMEGGGHLAGRAPWFTPAFSCRD